MRALRPALRARLLPRLLPWLAAAWAELEAAVYPPLCWLCRARPSVDGLGCAEHALAPCRFDPDQARCEGCAERLPAGVRTGPCAACRRRPRGFRRLLAAGPYRPEGALAQWILALKHGGRAELDRPLAAFLAAALAPDAAPPRGVLLTSVPLHPLRRFERGHDQAARLARALAEELDRPYLATLRRRRWTPPQGAPGARSRGANVEGAFRLRPGSAARLEGRALWLVDDVVTSGATARACAAELRRGGAREVTVVALARVERSANA
ncbi:MAG TPA: ComF family protein [Planctomycetota bacterium]